MATGFTLLFVLFLVLKVGTKLWLAARQTRHVATHADAVPAQFAERVTLDDHRKAAAYTIARQRFGMVQTVLSAVILLALTLLGGLQAISDALLAWVGSGFLFQVLLVGAVVLLVTLLDVPIEWYRQFRLEQAFGFNRMTPALFVTDLAKSLVLSAALGLPILALVLWLMGEAGTWWWVYAWGAWVGYTLLLTVLGPTLIAPLFNKFTPLPEGALALRINALLERTGFSSRGVFVMDGSRRSSHSNAYFTGLGRAKRVVFFDTLTERLEPPEIEAVLAHELGHFKLKHISRQLVLSIVASLAGFALLGWLAARPWFYLGLGVTPSLDGSNDALALLLFAFALPVFGFFVAPVAARFSRRYEYEADAFAARHAQASDLVAALVKLYQANASTLTPDPLHAAFYDSHPSAALRIERLLAGART